MVPFLAQDGVYDVSTWDDNLKLENGTMGEAPDSLNNNDNHSGTQQMSVSSANFSTPSTASLQVRAGPI
jgi:hypothetical protein